MDSVSLLTSSLDENKIRSQDSVAVINSIAHNPKGRLLAWEFLKDNYEELYHRYLYSVIDILYFVLSFVRSTGQLGSVCNARVISRYGVRCEMRA